MSQFLETQFTGLSIQRGSLKKKGSLLELANAFVAEDGTLVSRAGATIINTTQLSDGLGSNNVHSHILHGGRRYVGVGTIVKRSVDPGTPIISGLNGKRVSFLYASPSEATNNKPFTYFANGQGATHGAATGDCRKKDDGTTTYNWGIDGPTANLVALLAPATTSAQPSTTAIDSFAAAYTAVAGVGAEANAGLPYDTSARQFTVNASLTDRFRRAIALNLTGASEDDFIRVMLRVNQRQFLYGLEIRFTVGNVDNNYFFYKLSPFSFISDNNWQEFRIRKSEFTRVKPTGGSANTWANVDNVEFVVTATAKGNVIVSADDARLEADTHADGTYDYRLRWWNDTLKTRSNSRAIADVYAGNDAISKAVTSKRQSISIDRTGITTSDAQVTHWELWRRNRILGENWFYVDRIAIGTVTYTDTKTDDQLGEGWIDDDHIPPAAKFCFQFDGRVFLCGMSNQTANSGEEESAYVVRYSVRGKSESFPLNNYVVVGDPINTIQGWAVHAGSAYIWTKNAVYRLVGNNANSYTAVKIEAPSGTLSPYAIATSPYGIFFYAFGFGIMLLSGNSAVLISDDLTPIFEGISTGFGTFVVYPLDQNTPDKCENIVGVFANDQYYFSCVDTNGTKLTYVFDVQQRTWSRHYNTTAGSGWAVSRLSWERSGDLSVVNNVEAGTTDGWLSLLNGTGLLDGGSSPVPMVVQTKPFDAELGKDSSIDANFKEIVVDALTTASYTVDASYDEGAYVTAATVAFTTRARRMIGQGSPEGAGVIAYQGSVRIVLGTIARATVYGIGYNFDPEPPRVSAYSTDISTLEWPAPKRLQQLIIEADTYGTNITITTEADGTNLAQTFTLNHSGRKVSTFTYTATDPIATEVRLKFLPVPTPSNLYPWKLYSWRIEHIKEPPLILGHDSYWVQVFSTKPGWARKARLVLKNPATVTGTIYADNGASHPLSIGTNAAKTAVIVSFPIGLTGKAFRVVLASGSRFQLYPESLIELQTLDNRSFQPWRLLSD